MRMPVWAWVVVVLLAGCRDLSLPTTDRLSVVLPFDAVAPRQRLTVTASGGAGTGYVFSFAPGGALSGTSASLTATGEYQAGERGLAQDVLRVTDAAGNVADARIAVGAPLTLTPPISIVAPGGEVQFIAGGGQPPYVFTQGDGGLVANGLFRAEPTGDRLETITVTDATGDALAFARAQVSIGSGLVLFPAEASLAPRETLGFVGLGGQPPYRFALTTHGSTGSAGASIDALTGRYQAGANDADGGTSLDVVSITDRNGVTTEARVTVGPALRASVPTAVRPGERLVIDATGGKPPYGFAFAVHGNRSNGTVDGRTGAYTPGATPLAVDLLQVRDAVGTVVSLPPVRLGPLEFLTPWGRGATEIFEADLDQDFQPDLVASNPANLELMSALNVGRPTQSVVRTPLGPGGGQLVSLAPGMLLSIAPTDVLLYRSAGSGELVLRASAGVGPGDAVRAAWDQQRWLYRAARSVDCVGVERVDIFRLTAGLSAIPHCVAPTASRLFAVGTQGTATESYAYWLPDPGLASTSSAGPIEFAYFQPTLNTPAVSRTAQLPLPAGTVIGRQRLALPPGVGHLVDDARELGPDRVLALLTSTDGGPSKLWGFSGSGPTPLFAPLELTLPLPAVGITVTSGPPSLLASWDGASGRVLLHELQPDGGVVMRQLVDVPTSVSAAAFADVNNDRVKDLVTSDQQTGRQVMLFGEGDGTFSRRPRFRVTNDFYGTVELADLDDDGALDVVALAGQALQVFWGDLAEPTQFAAGPVSRLAATPTSSRVVRGAPGRSEFFFTDSRGGVAVSSADATGAFGAPRALTSADGSVERSVLVLTAVAELGGTAPGPDFLAVRTSAPVGYFALIRDAGFVARLVPVAATGSCALGATPLDASGLDGVIIACVDSQAGTFSLSTTRLQGSAFTAPSPVSGSPVAGAFAGFVEVPGGGSAVQGTGKLHRLVAQGGAVSLDTVDTSGLVFSPTLVQLDASAQRPHLVGLGGQDYNELIVQGWDGTRYVERQRLRLGRQWRAQALRRGATKHDDVLLQTESGDVFVLVNDGAGALR